MSIWLGRGVRTNMAITWNCKPFLRFFLALSKSMNTLQVGTFVYRIHSKSLSVVIGR
uniref:Uncharacterized protein n=1 Tax=Parascaris equorum TaxID=6256 RepID=A0A914RRG5_PAREQ